MDDETRRKFFIKSLGSFGTLILYGCEGRGSDGGPLGPSGTGTFFSQINVFPKTTSVTRGSTQAFVATGGTSSYIWSVGDLTLGSINSTSGLFTAGVIEGKEKVFATDTNGAVGSGIVTVVRPVIVVTPSSLIIPSTVTLPFTHTFTATGGASPYTFSASGEQLLYTGAAMNVTSGVLTVSALPTVLQGEQNLIITATDSFGDSSTASVNIKRA